MEQSKLKPLPRCTNKKKLRRIFGTYWTANHKHRLNEIICDNRNDELAKYKQNLHFKEYLIFLDFTGRPPGYSERFDDGERYQDKIKSIL